MFKPSLAMSIAALMNPGLVSVPKIQRDYIAPPGSGKNTGFKRNRRAELKRSARRTALCR